MAHRRQRPGRRTGHRRQRRFVSGDHARWTDDSVQRRRDRAEAAQGCETLLSVPIDGGTPKSLLDAYQGAWRPTISPDGTQVAFYYHERNGSVFLAVMPIGASRPTKTFEVAPSVAYAAVRWTADGKGLLHNSALKIARTSGCSRSTAAPLHKVTRFSDQTILAFDRSADGKTLIIARGTQSRDAVLIRNFR